MERITPRRPKSVLAIAWNLCLGSLTLLLATQVVACAQDKPTDSQAGSSTNIPARASAPAVLNDLRLERVEPEAAGAARPSGGLMSDKLTRDQAGVGYAPSAPGAGQPTPGP